MNNFEKMDEVYKQMRPELDVWEEYAMMSLETGSEEIRIASENLLNEILSKYNWSENDFLNHLSERIDRLENYV